MDINCLAMEETTVVQDLLLWLAIGVIMMEGEGPEGEVVITGGVAEEEDLGREEEGGEGTEADQGPAQVGTLGIGGRVLEGAMVVKGKGLVPVEISIDKAKGLIHHALSLTGKGLGQGGLKVQDLQELQLPPPLILVLLTWDQILETWVLLPKTMQRLFPSFQLAWVEVVEQVAECPRWRISMPIGKKIAWLSMTVSVKECMVSLIHSRSSPTFRASPRHSWTVSRGLVFSLQPRFRRNRGQWH